MCVCVCGESAFYELYLFDTEVGSYAASMCFGVSVRWFLVLLSPSLAFIKYSYSYSCIYLYICIYIYIYMKNHIYIYIYIYNPNAPSGAHTAAP